MRFARRRLRVPLLIASLLPGALFAAEEVTLAVASNFARTAAEISAVFTRETGVAVRISQGSTGKLYAQIIHGAPYDVFLAADAERPLLLERSGQIVSGSRRTYATGRLVLWSRDESLRGKDCWKLLQRGAYDRLALANPATAPYGAAAREFLIGEGLWGTASARAVYGENISQTLQFVATQNAMLGFVANSQTADPLLPEGTCAWLVPESAHAPLNQQRVMLRRAAGNDGARRYLEFLDTPAARRIIVRHGYQVN